MRTEEALAEYEKEAEAYHRARLAVQRGEKASMRHPRRNPVQSLEDFPQKPKVVWIVRPPGYSGDDTLERAFHFDSIVCVSSSEGKLGFKRNSGRSIKGHNALRHGRINWPETHRRFSAWWKDSQHRIAEYERNLRALDDKWRRWVWDQNDAYRKYLLREGLWYALTRYPQSSRFRFSVACAHDKSALVDSEVFENVEQLQKIFPFLAPLASD